MSLSKPITVSVDVNDPHHTQRVIASQLDELLRKEPNYPVLRIKFLSAGYSLPPVDLLHLEAPVAVVDEPDAETEDEDEANLFDEQEFNERERVCREQLAEVIRVVDGLTPDKIDELCAKHAQIIVKRDIRDAVEKHDKSVRSFKQKIARLRGRISSEQSSLELRRQHCAEEAKQAGLNAMEMETENLVNIHKDELINTKVNAEKHVQLQHASLIRLDQERILQLEADLTASNNRMETMKTELEEAKRTLSQVPAAVKDRARQIVNRSVEKEKQKVESKKRDLISVEDDRAQAKLTREQIEQRRNKQKLDQEHSQNRRAMDLIRQHFDTLFVGSNTDADDLARRKANMDKLRAQCQAVSSAQAVQEAILTAGSELNRSFNDVTMDAAAMKQVRRYIPQAVIFYNLNKYVLVEGQSHTSLKEIFPELTVLREGSQMARWKEQCELARLAYDHPQVMSWKLSMDQFYMHFEGLVRVVDAVGVVGDVTEFRSCLKLAEGMVSEDLFAGLRALWG